MSRLGCFLFPEGCTGPPSVESEPQGDEGRVRCTRRVSWTAPVRVSDRDDPPQICVPGTRPRIGNFTPSCPSPPPPPFSLVLLVAPSPWAARASATKGEERQPRRSRRDERGSGPCIVTRCRLVPVGLECCYSAETPPSLSVPTLPRRGRFRLEGGQSDISHNTRATSHLVFRKKALPFLLAVS